MSLLTTQEYQTIADNLNLPNTAFINGGYRPAKSGAVFTSINPATGKKLTDIAACDAQDVDEAVIKAREAFDDGRWCKLHPSERKNILITLCKLLTRNARELAVMESMDSGKPIYDCESVDVPEMIECIKWHAELIDKIYDSVAPVSDEHIAMILREPIGVVGLVLPWNFPLLMMAWKIAPALAAGCSVIVKPAEETSLTALRVAELCHEAGIPKGVLNIVPGLGAQAGEALGRHHDIDMISFTGSTVTGKKFLEYSAQSNCKEVVLEMGGKNPCIVMDDAENLDAVAQHIVNGAFWNMGENCSAISRLIVHKNIKEDLLKRVEHHIQHWNIGNPLDPETRLGALVSDAHCKKVSGYINKAKTIRAGGKIEKNYVEATLIELASNQDILAREEIFGPVLSILTITSFDEAILVANDTNYGLTAALFTSNIKNAIRGGRALQAGTVTINSYGEGNITTPFGGYKQSGFGGRDNSIHAHDQYTQIKTLWIDLTDDADSNVD